MNILLLGLLLFGASTSTGPSEPPGWSKRIVSRTTRPLSSYLSPHVSRPNVLIIDGKRFKHVRGVKTFYLPVPQIKAIVFVVDEKDYSATYHVFRMDTDEDIAIPTPWTVFGQSIGSASPEDTVSVANGSTLILRTTDHHAKSTLPELAALHTVESLYYLDLSKKAVVREKTIYLDEAGRVIRE